MRTPLMTLKKLIRPAKGSVMVLKTIKERGSLSSILRVRGSASRASGVAEGTSMVGMRTAMGARSMGAGQ